MKNIFTLLLSSVFKKTFYLFTILICISSGLYANGKPANPATGRHDIPIRGRHLTGENKKQAAAKSKQLNALALPVVSYASPQTYVAGTAIAPLVPSATGVGAPAYNNNLVFFAGGFNDPQAIAIDKAGNVYVADAVNGLIKKFTSAGGGPVNVGTGLQGPTGIAIDAAGNIFVTDITAGAVKEIQASNGFTLTIADSLNNPVGMAVDLQNNVYITIPLDGRVVKFPAGGGPSVDIGSGFNRPSTVTTDTRGNIYISSVGDSTVKIIRAGTLNPEVIGSGFIHPGAVAVDAAGNIYVPDFGKGTIVMMPPGGGVPVTIATGIPNPGSLATDRSGVIYVSDFGENTVSKLNPVGGYYISGLPRGLSIDSSTGVISGTPTTPAPATNYTVTAYNATGRVQTTINITVTAPPKPAISYAGPQVYTAGTTITPLAPVSSNVSVLAYGTPATFATGLNQPLGLATDSKGNIYVSDSGNKNIKKYPPGGGIPAIIGNGTLSAINIAVDAAGNIFVADIGSGTIKEVLAASGFIATISNLPAPAGIAVDAAGNLYVTFNTALVKIPVGGGQPIVIASGLSSPLGVAVDAAGNVYVANSGGNHVILIKPDGEQVSIGSGFNQPISVALDVAGNIYVAELNGGTVKMMPPGGGTPVIVTAIATRRGGVAIDAIGNLFVSDFENGTIEKIKPAGGYFISGLLPGLNFNSSTGVISGTPAGAKPATSFTVTGYNVSGNNHATVNIEVDLPPKPTLTYAGAQTYSKGTAIAPLAPVSSNVGAPGYKNPVAFATGIGDQNNIKIDAAGNVYVADFTNSVVLKYPVGGGAPVNIGFGFSGPRDIAIDAAGNIYVGDTGNHALKKVPVGGGAVITLDPDVGDIQGVTIDPAGNLFFTSGSSGNLRKIAAGDTAKIVLASGFSSPRGVAVDAAGNAYVADNVANTVFKVPAGGGVGVSVTPGISQLFNLALDATGNLYVTDYGHGLLKRFPPGGGDPVAIGGFIAPVSVAVDGAGVVYYGELAPGAVKKLVPSGGYYASGLPKGLNFDNNTGIISGTPAEVSPATNYTVSAYNLAGVTKANLNIKVSPFNTDLSNLTLSADTLSPVFAPATTGYAATVGNLVTTIKITPTASAANATIKVNNTAVASGTASEAIPLAVGPNTISVVVTAADGSTTKSYTVTVTRASSNAVLIRVKVTPATTLTLVTGTHFRDYTTTVPNTESNVQISVTAQDTTATIKVNGVTTASGTASAAIPLNVGDNIINTVVTAQDGVTVKIYSIKFTRLASTNANLAGLTLNSGVLSPVFAAGTTSYSATVTNATASVTVKPTTADATATIKVNGATVASGSASASLPLVVGPNTITTVVTAQDGSTTKTYTIIVTRSGSANASLTLIKVTPATKLTVVTGPDFRDYTTTVPNTETSVQISPTAQDAAATIKVNGVTVASGAASAAIPLTVGDNVINTVVTAQDGVTTKTYSIKFTRLPSANAGLANFALSSGTLTPAFTTATTNYNATVNNATASVKVTPTATDAGATITVNGVAVASGSASASLPLVAGPNTITAVVTAQNGVNTKTYTVTVTRVASTNASLTLLKVTPVTKLTVVSGPDFQDYTTTVPNSEASVQISPTAQDATATIKVNGVTVASGAASAAIPLNIGTNVINTVVTAQDGVSHKTYSITFTRQAPAGAAMAYQPQEQPAIGNDIIVHQNVSPNGDGSSDVWLIEGITAYPDNKVQVMSRSGVLVYEAKGYDNTTRVFDGHSSINGKLQQAGTYFYSLEYKDGNSTKHKTGFIVLKY